MPAFVHPRLGQFLTDDFGTKVSPHWYKCSHRV